MPIEIFFEFALLRPKARSRDIFLSADVTIENQGI